MSSWLRLKAAFPVVLWRLAGLGLDASESRSLSSLNSSVDRFKLVSAAFDATVLVVRLASTVGAAANTLALLRRAMPDISGQQESEEMG